MRTVILFVELLRSKPSAVFWAAAIAQALLWWLVPTLFYAAPPGDLAITLAAGRQFRLGYEFGPPLAYWVAEIAHRIGGLTFVYLVAQLCVLTAYWAMFALGRSLVGARHAALAVLLMAGVFPFTMPTAEFGPNVLAMPLWAMALLYYWRAAREERLIYWLALGLVLGLLLLTTYAGLVLVVLFIAFTLLTPHGRAQLMSVEPWIGGVIVVLLTFPHLIWLEQNGGAGFAAFSIIEQNLNEWLMLLVMLAAGHVGLLILVAIGYVLPPLREGVPELTREPVDPAARLFILVFAPGAAILSVALAAFGGGAYAFVSAPLVLLSALAVIVAAPDRIAIAQQRLAAWAWAAVLVLPPIGMAFAIVLLPWLYPIDLRVAQPADELGRFFEENYQRRAGRKLAIVAGDARLASLIALAAPSRPDLFVDAKPELTPWVTAQRIATEGVLVVWFAGTTRLPPAAIRERIPGLVAEAPQAFVRRVQGRLPPIRIGWAVVPPRALAAIPSGP
jgi:4-amino-4-deoxy-L-arabinose transferase-like glycosyltransferase